ncbi:copper resistance protein CopC [Mycobacterium hodleri]|uniref:Copper resistance protein CopC n=1 Tax=Mycolicibacterium hodleri TaxID=49897 RepID=A0A544W625_9MYCO|nr:copper resistance CopC family protein [Mycolicibacterium hodleri]TQR87679.1 copper resistance protein CopC [Mycolicibacterium hodleri]
MNTIILRTIAAALIALALSSAGVGIAAAHTALVSSDPAKDANLSTAPTAVVLTFSEDINPAFATVVVKSADGSNWVGESPQVDGPRLTAAVGPGRLATGEYTVGYRVVSTDGHPVTGSYTFTIAASPGEPPPPPASTEPTPSAAAAPSQSAPAGSDTKTTVITALVAGLALGGAIAFWQSRKHRRNGAVAESTGPLNPADPGEDPAAR